MILEAIMVTGQKHNSIQIYHLPTPHSIWQYQRDSFSDGANNCWSVLERKLR